MVFFFGGACDIYKTTFPAALIFSCSIGGVCRYILDKQQSSLRKLEAENGGEGEERTVIL